MKRISLYMLLISLVCLPQISCRSTLYKAAQTGDIATVQRELDNGANVNDGMADMGPANILYLPYGVLLMATDISTIVLMIGTFGQYYHVIEALGDTNRPFILQNMSATPLDAALDAGHYNIASLLRENGGDTHYSRHYHGDYTEAPTEHPRIPIRETEQTAQAEQKTTPQASAPPTRPEPQPSIGQATGGVSAR